LDRHPRPHVPGNSIEVLELQAMPGVTSCGCHARRYTAVVAQLRPFPAPPRATDGGGEADEAATATAARAPNTPICIHAATDIEELQSVQNGGSARQ
jgi:hypothetical protein